MRPTPGGNIHDVDEDFDGDSDDNGTVVIMMMVMTMRMMIDEKTKGGKDKECWLCKD